MNKITVLQHVACEGPGLISEVAAGRGIALEVIDAAAAAAALEPGLLDQSSGLVILGGPPGVYEAEAYPWLNQEMALCRYALEHDLPLLGICLGAQVLAAAAGGRVYPAGLKEIGWFSLSASRLAREDGVFSVLPAAFMAFEWHGDTFDLPPGAELLASSALCPNQAFRAGKCAYGLQFHLEITAAMISEWLTVYRDELLELGGEQVCESIAGQTARYAGELAGIAYRFLERWMALGRR